MPSWKIQNLFKKAILNLPGFERFDRYVAFFWILYTNILKFKVVLVVLDYCLLQAE